MKIYTRSKGSKAVRAKQNAAQGLYDLFLNELEDIYDAEKSLTKALPQSIENSSSDELIKAISDHLQVTNEQVKRLEEVFEIIGVKASSRNCDAMDGLIKETEDIIKSTEKGVVRDAGIIAAAQKIEHYEIASYGTLRSFANILGEYEAASLLEETLDEEKAADTKLTEIAESKINLEAFESGKGEEENEENPESQHYSGRHI